MAQQGTGGTKYLLIRVKVGEGVKATIKIPPSQAAAVLAELAKDPRAGSGVLLDKAGVNVLASEGELLPDDGPFEYLLQHGGAGVGVATGAGQKWLFKVAEVINAIALLVNMVLTSLTPTNGTYVAVRVCTTFIFAAAVLRGLKAWRKW